MFCFLSQCNACVMQAFCIVLLWQGSDSSESSDATSPPTSAPVEGTNASSSPPSVPVSPLSVDREVSTSDMFLTENFLFRLFLRA